ncbi:MAG: Gfo/Idh/MocA family protein [Candidatus Brocadiia bacterium]
MSPQRNDETSRRDFMKSAMATGAAAGGLTILGATARGQAKGFKIGLVGCGGRGKGAVVTALAAAKQMDLDVQVVALADYFQSQLDQAAERFEVPKSQCFAGPKGYQKLLDTDLDVVLLATPPIFRPVHFEAAVQAGKHVFMEKPVAVDPVGARRVMATGEEAKKKGLTVVAGTQRRHSRAYRKVHFYVTNGAIGEIKDGCVWWCQGGSWAERREEGESDADYLVRNWMNFVEMSGDHIVEQHVHNIDIANWFLGRPPRSAGGFGLRHRRETGNIYDFFSIDFDYGGGCHVHSMCRQINGCWNMVHEYFTGTQGHTYGRGGTRPKPEDLEAPDFEEARGGPYVEEHAALFRSLLSDQKLNEAQHVAESTLTGIMGRISAYRGQRVEWRHLTDPKAKSPLYSLQLKPAPEDFETGDVTAPKEEIPRPGKG